MCLNDASVPNISAISEKSNFPHIFADINDNFIRPMVIHFIHSFIYYADILKRLDLCSAHAIYLYLIYF